MKHRSTKHSMILIPFTLIALSACSGSGGGSGPGVEPYSGSRDIDLQSAAGPAATDQPAPVAQAASLLLELTDQLDDYVDDLDELSAVISGTCRDGGSVDVVQVSANGEVARTLNFQQCIDGGDYYDGLVELRCAASGCAGDGSIRFGDAGRGFVDQDLDERGAPLRIVDGAIEFAGLSASRDSGALTFDLDAQFADADGVIGAVRFTDLTLQIADLGATEEARYDGSLRFTAFRTPSGSCDAAGTLSVATPATLVYDDARDRTEAGELSLGQIAPAKITWSAGAVTATAGGATQSYAERDFDAICDF